MRTNPHSIAGCFVAILLILGWPIVTHAQAVGQVAGSIHDQTGGALAGVAVTLDGPEHQAAVTSISGEFAFRSVRPGPYQLTAALKGFESIHRTVPVESGRAPSLSLTMALAAVEATIVTATKAGTAEIQITPAAISALPSTDLEPYAIRSLDQAVGRMPSVTFTQNSTFGQLSIRGIGTNAVNAGSDPSSAMYLDGVYLARPAMTFVDLLDLERIEVLRGPQGTLYGRNAVGGALNLVSSSP